MSKITFSIRRFLNLENYSWNVPKNVENYLTIMYDDYTKIPEIEDRESHIILEIKFPDEV